MIVILLRIANVDVILFCIVSKDLDSMVLCEVYRDRLAHSDMSLRPAPCPVNQEPFC